MNGSQAPGPPARLIKACLLIGAVIGALLALDAVFNGGHLMAAFMGRPPTLHRP